MNILISSSTQWNPGDDFIRDGVKRLLKEAGVEGNCILYNRNPDLFVGGPHDNRMRQDLWSNVAQRLNLSHIDLVVLAGTPEWTGAPLKSLYDALLAQPKPLLALGVGCSHEGLQLSRTEMQVLARPESLVITRGPTLAKELVSQLGREVKTLPCPAMFCTPPSPQGRGNLAIVQGTATVNQSISPQLAAELASVGVDGRAAFYVDELKEYRHLSPFYSHDYRAYYEHLAGYEYVATTRLHGALMALALGKKVALLADPGNYRVREAASMFPMLKVVDKALDVTYASMNEGFKEATKAAYITAIKEAMCRK